MTNSLFPEDADDIIKASLPNSVIKERSGGGGKSLSYISGSTVIDILNAAFNRLWDFEIIRVWKEDSIDKFNKKYDKEPQPQNPVAHAIVRITIPILDKQGNVVYTLKKMGTGSKSVLGGQSDQESIFKAAVTDALKKAASTLGIGLELYRDDDEQEFFDNLNDDDPWTDEALAQYEKESNFIQEFMTTNELTADDMSEYVQGFSDNALSQLGDIVPDNIEAFVAYLNSLVENSEEGE